MAITAESLDIDVRGQLRGESSGMLHGIGRAARKNPVGAVAGVFCLLLVLLAIFGPTLAPYEATRVDFARLAAPSAAHPFGTDNLLRDMFSRILIGTRTSLGVAFASIAVSTIFGVLLGITSGYLGGTVDMLVSRIIDVSLAFPPLVFLIFFLTIFTPTFFTVALAIGVVLTPGTTRVVRSSTIGVRHLQFIEAAVALGNSPFRIMYRHVFPNVAASIIVIASVQIGVAILIEAAISFLGLGVSSAANPSWGRMLQETRTVWQLGWWTCVVPGAAISIAVLSYNIFGDALRDALDPRLRGSR
jgi:peptide/nickel transport system permease protein